MIKLCSRHPVTCGGLPVPGQLKISSSTLEVRGWKANCVCFGLLIARPTSLFTLCFLSTDDSLFFHNSNAFFGLKIGRSLHRYCKLQQGIIIGKRKLFPHALQHTPAPPWKLWDYHFGSACNRAWRLKNGMYKYILKQWIVLNARADWLVKLRISCAIYLQATRGKMAS